MSSYKIGQVIYIVLNKEIRIYPMQVVEELVKRSLEGEQTTYMVRAGPAVISNGSVAPIVPISQVNGEIFQSINAAREALTERAIASINKLILAASQKAQEWYPNAVMAEETSDDVFVTQSTPVLTTKKQRSRKEGKFDPVAELQADLQREASSIDESSIILLPDGTRAKVSSIKLPEQVQ